MGHKTYGEMLGTYEVTMAGIHDPDFNGVYTASRSPSTESRSWYYAKAPGNTHFTVSLGRQSRGTLLNHVHISVDVGGVNGKIQFEYNSKFANLRAYKDVRNVRPGKDDEFYDFAEDYGRSLDEMALKFFGIATGVFLTKIYDRDTGDTFNYDDLKA
jgi:hypothetical protein